MLTLLLLAQVASGSPVCLSSVEIRPHEEVASFHYGGLELAGRESIEVAVDLDIGQSIEGYEVVLNKMASCEVDYVVQWQYETSVSIMDEGPHLDLLEWKHHTARWTELEEDSAGRYWLPTLSEEERTAFPATAVSELIGTVQAEGGDRWADLLVDLTEIGEYPSGVGLSAIRVRIVAFGQPLYFVTFRLAMGC